MHMIEKSDMIFTRLGDARAWHSLDTQIDFLTHDWKTQGFGYSVDVRELQTALGFTGAHGLVSSRNGKLMRLCSIDAVVDQPAAIASWFEKLAGLLGAPIVSAGTLEDTARFFLCAEIPHTLRDLGNGDTISRYVVLTGSYDGMHPMGVYQWDVRAVCNNTLPSATHENGVLFKARNGKAERLTASLCQQVADSILNMRAEVLQKQADVFGGLVSSKIDPYRDVNPFAHLVAGDGGKLLDRVVKFDDAQLRGDNGQYGKASLLDRCLMATIDVAAWRSLRAFEMSPTARKIAVNTLEGMGADLPTARETAWGLLNAATQTFDHDSKREAVQQVEARMFQSFAAEKQNALVLASAIANTNW